MILSSEVTRIVKDDAAMLASFTLLGSESNTNIKSSRKWKECVSQDGELEKEEQRKKKCWKE